MQENFRSLRRRRTTTLSKKLGGLFIWENCFENFRRRSKQSAKRKRWKLERWGLVKERGDARKLLVDVDVKRRGENSAKALKLALRNVDMLAHTLRLKREWARVERSAGGRGWHVVVKTREKLAPAEQVAAEVICGSDAARARLDLYRLRANPSGYDGWSLLFEGKLY